MIMKPFSRIFPFKAKKNIRFSFDWLTGLYLRDLKGDFVIFFIELLKFNFHYRSCRLSNSVQFLGGCCKIQKDKRQIEFDKGKRLIISLTWPVSAMLVYKTSSYITARMSFDLRKKQMLSDWHKPIVKNMKMCQNFCQPTGRSRQSGRTDGKIFALFPK